MCHPVAPAVAGALEKITILVTLFGLAPQSNWLQIVTFMH